MRRILSGLLVCFLILGTFFLGHRMFVSHAEESGGIAGTTDCAREVGDVDASDAVDLTDALTILSYLFLGEPEELVPSCFAQGGGTPGGSEAALAAIEDIFADPIRAEGPPDGEPFVFQTVLRSGGELIQGVVDLEFYLYTSADRSVVDDLGVNRVSEVPITDGIVSVKLSFAPALFDGSERWVEVRVEDPSEPGVIRVIVPRIPLCAVPYALAAGAVSSVAFDETSPVNRLSVWDGVALVPSLVSEDGTQVLVNDVAVIDQNGQWIGDPTGLRGSRGDQGEQGIQGLQGPQGDQGDQGKAGFAYDVRRSTWVNGISTHMGRNPAP